MRVALLLLLVSLAACDQNMVQQPRYDSYEEAPLFGSGQAMQHPPEGVVARHADRGEARPPLTTALLARGAERFGIYCAPCHGADGSGDGMIPARGFPRPPNLLGARLVAAPDSHIYRVITEGYGVMYSYADRVPPADRWAIVAHVRLLQHAGGAR